MSPAWINASSTCYIAEAKFGRAVAINFYCFDKRNIIQIGPSKTYFQNLFVPISIYLLKKFQLNDQCMKFIIVYLSCELRWANLRNLIS